MINPSPDGSPSIHLLLSTISKNFYIHYPTYMLLHQEWGSNSWIRQNTAPAAGGIETGEGADEEGDARWAWPAEGEGGLGGEQVSEGRRCNTLGVCTVIKKVSAQ